jgi:hypothetical protein
MSPTAEIYYEQLEYDYARLSEFRDKITEAVQALHEVLDADDIFEKYPGVEAAIDRAEKLL